MRLMGDFWLGLIGFRGEVLAQDRCIGFHDRSGNTQPGASLALSRQGYCQLGPKEKPKYMYMQVYIYMQSFRFVCTLAPKYRPRLSPP